jgi:hypothetical protein
MMVFEIYLHFLDILIFITEVAYFTMCVINELSNRCEVELLLFDCLQDNCIHARFNLPHSIS